MSELRQNLASKDWVVISPKRGEKPNKVLTQVLSNPRPEHAYEPECPFCSGNEAKFEVEEIQCIPDDQNGWFIRSVNNKYGIFSDFETCPDRLTPFDREGIYQKYMSCGNHEVVIETNRHNQAITDLGHEDICKILTLYVDRHRAFQKNPNNLITFIFKNYGVLAGQTQPHSHSQIVGSRVVPLYIRSLLHEAEKNFDTFGSCVFCDMIEFERKEAKRIILEGKDHIAFVPFAASSEHAVWILPKKHAAGISNLDKEELDSLASVFADILKRYQKLMGNPDFNYVFRMAPYPLENVPFYHWYIEIMPRTKIGGGFEKATQMPVNTVLPEESAEMLRKCMEC